MFRFVIPLITMAVIVMSKDLSGDPRLDSVPPNSPTFGPGECPPIVVGRTTYNNGICDGLLCKYEVKVVGSTIGATATRIQNNCFN
ncbi:hypothetical protein DdX_02674 [Ditylenchus destructor]|uniref:Uncharacterized protein n=1 Tax=Ditylenchus destructor TaxID=166010 RepID=A0AAD4NHT9_9BILA|nr:hypothetical protein DdX_02672 [Ditylenchus destructor]KAI1725982.1 hypothetical protein DdX_02674 [Ditylenchus destructor]